MATVLLDPGGDSTFDTSLEPVVSGTVTVVSDFVRGGHQRSYKFATGGSNWLSPNIAAVDAGGRVSHWFYFNALPTGTTELIDLVKSGPGAAVAMVLMTSAGVILLGNGSSQLGSNGPTLATGNWYRISFAWKITSTMVNQFLVTVGNAAGTILGTIAVTNGTLVNTTSGALILGNFGGDATLDMRASDIYVDNATSVIDPGNIGVAAKRSFANGTTNGFTTQIGSGGSGYGTGHAPQVNERPLSTTNGWSMIGAGSAVTEEYTIEGVSVGDIDLTGATIVDFMGWVSAKSLTSETGKIVLAGTSTNISLTSTTTIFKQIAASTTYPSTGAAIGITTATTLTTVSLFECGVVVAYIPPVSIAQVAANVTATGGTQTIATGNKVAISQVAANLTTTGGTQAIATVNNIAISQLAATVTASGGTQSIATINDVSIAQVGATLTTTGGVQVIQTNSSNAQAAATLTATGGTQVVAAIQDVAVTQVGASLTVADGGGTTVATINDVSITQSAAVLTISGGVQSLSVMADIALAQLAASITAAGGTQAVSASSGLSNVSVTQVGADLTVTGGTQIISINTSPLPPSRTAKVIFLLDGRMALRVSGNVYLPL